MKKDIPPSENGITQGELHAFVDGLLGFERRHDVIEHLTTHPEVANRVDEYLLQTARIRELGNMLDLDDSDRFCPDLQRALIEARQKRPAVWPRYLAIAASLAVLATGSLVALDLLPGGEDSERVVAEALVESDALVIERDMVVEQSSSTQQPLKTVAKPAMVRVDTGEVAETPVAWLTRHMGDHVLNKPDLLGIGLRFVEGKVLSDAAAPSIQLIYEDGVGHQVFIYAGLLPDGMQPAFATVPEGHFSLTWRRAPLLFGLIAPTEIPKLDEMMRLVGDGLARVPAAPPVETLVGVPKPNEVRKAARLAEGGALVVPLDMLVGHSVAIPVPRPDYQLRPGAELTPRQPLPPIGVEQNKPEPL